MDGSLFTAARMRAIEAAHFESGAATGAELMERAGTGAVAAMEAAWPDLAARPGRAVIACGPGNTFRANGSNLADPGFMIVYRESLDDAKEDDERLLPEPTDRVGGNRAAEGNAQGGLAQVSDPEKLLTEPHG